MTGRQVADGRFSTQGHRYCSAALIAGRVVPERPFVRHTRAEATWRTSPRRRIADGGEAARRVATGPPTARRVLDVGVKHVALAKQAQGNGVCRSPLIDRRGIKERDQNMKLPTAARSEERRVGKR